MFHVHQDIRTKKSAFKIAETLMNLLQQKDFAEITITDIQKKTGIARTTFYRSFDNLIDVLEWKCNQQFSDIFEKYHGLDEFPTERQIFQDCFQYFSDHDELLTILIKIQRIDIIYKYQYQFAEKMVEEYGPKVQYKDIPLNYFLAVRTGFFLGIILTWIKNGKKESIAELQEIAANQIKQLSEI